jgi:hypothetical protein
MMRVKLKVLSPVHIGSGEALNRLDYFLDGGRFCRVTLDALFADKDFASQRDKFLEAAPGGQPLDRLVPRDLLKKHVSYDIRMSPAALDFASSHPVEVKTCIKSAGRVYVPGSSVKGAMLSALCWKVLREGWGRGKDAQSDICELVLGRDPDALLSAVIPRLGGRAAEQLGKFTHWLDVSDSGFKTPDECLAVSLVDVRNMQPRTGYRRGLARDLRLLCETIQGDAEFSFEMELDPESKLKSLDEAVSTVNDFYQSVAKADGIPTDSLNLPTTGLVRLGGGSGSYATSLLLFAKEAKLDWGRDGYRVRPPKSRKRAGKADCPMGWAQMTLTP